MSNMTLQDRDGQYSTYATDYGDLRVRDGEILTRELLPQYLPVGELWDVFEAATAESMLLSRNDREELFGQYVIALGMTWNATDIAFCNACRRPDWDDEVTADTADDGKVCGTCADNDYTECVCCNRLWRTRTMNREGRVVDGDPVCEPCIESYYHYCENCEEWYHEDDSDAHDHSYECDCFSPQQEFRVRNGGGFLANDEEAVVTVPGRVSAQGISAIRVLLREQEDARFYDFTRWDMDDLDPDWQTRAGNYPKRLGKLAYDRRKLKIPANVLAQIGTIARDHSAGESLTVAVTRDLNMSAEEFYHGGSCWWDNYAESRCALKNSGGYGLRSFNGRTVTGRAWVMPLKRDGNGLVPTFDAETPAALVAFNGYGQLSGYAAARLLAHMAGWSYAKIDFKCAPMYVNGARGYLIGPEEIIRGTGSLCLSVDQHADLYGEELRENARKEAAHVA